MPQEQKRMLSTYKELVLLIAVAVMVIGLCWLVTHGDSVTVRPQMQAVLPRKFFNSSPGVADTTRQPLPAKVVDGIKKVTFLVGYPGSGHTLLATLLDAHPHMVVENNCSILEGSLEGEWRGRLFNDVYRHSIGGYRQKHKGHDLTIEGQWQGKYDAHIEVIGSKCGRVTVSIYKKDREGFVRYYQGLKEKLQVRVIHALRNPYDIIATSILVDRTHYKVLNSTNSSLRWSGIQKISVPGDVIQKTVASKFGDFTTVVELIEKVFGRENVFEVHNSQLVADPRGTLSRLYQFLGVRAPAPYLDACVGKIFTLVSRSREGLAWSRGQVAEVQRRMRQFPMFSRYSFTSD